MRVLVCGGREYDDWTVFANTMYRHFHPDATGEECRKSPTIIHGDAKGADFMARLWAICNGFDEVRFPADWKAHGKGAGPIRNQRMLDEGKPDVVVAFPGGKGTVDMVARAKKAGIPVIEILNKTVY